MARMNGTGPEKKGPLTGRGLGNCRKVSTGEAVEKLGTGIGLRRNAGGGKGKGKRLRSGMNSTLRHE
ncbi:MAG TPA: DUF5320 family protein [Bacteroidales bacterium]|nr:DUF5320 family protein [Bacteroidales bacterium]